MMLGRVNTKQSSEPYMVPAPIGGLNGRDPYAAMPPMDAFYMDNVFPNTASAQSRQGCIKYTDATLGAAPVQTLDIYAGADGDQMLAWAGTKIWDVSLATPVELATGMVSAVAINAMVSNAADDAQHLISVTGYDTPKHYNGSVIANLAMTGITTPADLNYVFTFKERLYFAAREKIGFYYLPVGQIQGALSYFDLGQVSRLGGYLQSIASYSQGGETPDDYIVFITSKGECIVYAGNDPSAAASWSLVGRYFAAEPIGPRCTINFNSELIILTLDGALPFSLIRRNGDANSGGVTSSREGALTSKLGKFLSSLNPYSDTPGWQGVQYPKGGWLLLNAATTGAISGDFYQYVMNTTTGAWCRFTNWNALCFTVFNKRLYFGRYDGYVMLADEGRDDDGADIQCDVKQAYNYFADERGAGPLQKHFQWATLIIAADGAPALSGQFNVDFTEEQPGYIAVPVSVDGFAWDSTDWDAGDWTSGPTTQRVLLTLNRGGFAGSLWMRVTLNGQSLEWFATQFVMQRTQGLLLV